MSNFYVGSKHRTICADGVVRTATVTGEPDTWFSVPARVSARKKTISGFISMGSDDQWHFHAYRYRKNGGVIPVIPEQEQQLV